MDSQSSLGIVHILVLVSATWIGISWIAIARFAAGQSIWLSIFPWFLAWLVVGVVASKKVEAQLDEWMKHVIVTWVSASNDNIAIARMGFASAIASMGVIPFFFAASRLSNAKEIAIVGSVLWAPWCMFLGLLIARMRTVLSWVGWLIVVVFGCVGAIFFRWMGLVLFTMVSLCVNAVVTILLANQKNCRVGSIAHALGVISLVGAHEVRPWMIVTNGIGLHADFQTWDGSTLVTVTKKSERKIVVQDSIGTKVTLSMPLQNSSIATESLPDTLLIGLSGLSVLPREPIKTKAILVEPNRAIAHDILEGQYKSFLPENVELVNQDLSTFLNKNTHRYTQIFAAWPVDLQVMKHLQNRGFLILGGARKELKEKRLEIEKAVGKVHVCSKGGQMVFLLSQEMKNKMFEQECQRLGFASHKKHKKH